MAFLTAIPQELLSAAAQLEGIGNALTAQNTGAAAATTAIAPAAADPVSALQSTIFSTYGTLYQQIAAEAQAIQQQFASTLGLSSGTYTETEAANVVAATPVQNFLNESARSSVAPSRASDCAGRSACPATWPTFSNIGGGNWASAASDLLGMAGGGLLRARRRRDAGADAAAAAGAADAVGATAPAAAGRHGRDGRHAGRGHGLGDHGRQFVRAAQLGRRRGHSRSGGRPQADQRGLDRRSTVGRDGRDHPRHARDGRGRAQQCRLRCAALWRQAHRHAEASSRLSQPRNQTRPKGTEYTKWHLILQLCPPRSTPASCTPVPVQDR